MPIQAIIVLDSTGRPIFQSHLQLSESFSPLLHIDAFLASTKTEPVLFVTTPNGPAICSVLNTGDLSILCPSRGDDDPMLAAAFLQSFAHVLQTYIGDLSVHSFKEHLDIVYQLWDEMLYAGHPLTMEPNVLRDLVIPPSLLNKLVSISGLSSLSKPTPPPFASAVPWRKSGLRYTSNEIYFDLVEEMQAIVAKNGSTINSIVSGQIRTQCKLSGTPDLTLAFRNPECLEDVTCHQCVRIPKWIRDKTISFVPPDGHFTLMCYRYEPPPGNPLSKQQAFLPLPVLLQCDLEVDGSSSYMKAEVISKSREAIDNFSLEVPLATGSSTSNCVVGAGSTWGYDPQSSVLKWEMVSILPGSKSSFKCNISLPIQFRSPRSVFTKFSLSQRTFSNLKVEQLKVSGETYKPYKGVRGNATSIIEWRLQP